jgi:hypothetical protein
MKKRIMLVLICAVILAGLMYAAHTTDFFRIVQRIHHAN